MPCELDHQNKTSDQDTHEKHTEADRDCVKRTCVPEEEYEEDINEAQKDYYDKF